MVLLLIDFLQNMWGLKVPAVFTYYSTRMILALITTLLICIGLGPRFIRRLYELKVGQPIRMEDCPLLGQLHEKKKDTPTMGGVLILAAMLVAMLLWMNLQHIFTFILLLTTLVLGGMGGYDDFLKLKYRNSEGLSARKKLLYQVGLSTAVAFYLLCPFATEGVHMGKWFAPPQVKQQQATGEIGTSISATPVDKGLSLISLQEYASRLYIPFIKDPVIKWSGLGLLAAGIWIVLVIAGASNAVNLTDGLDGLAAGCLIMVASCLALVAFVSNNIEIAQYLNILYVEGSGEIAIYLCAFAGACLGFLWYNGYPAQVFMGDTGSLALGGIIGVSAVLLRREMLLAIIGGIFVAEALSVILQVASYRLRNKKRVFLCAPLHHHFEYKGWAETKIVIRFWIIGLLLAMVGVASLKFQ